MSNGWPDTPKNGVNYPLIQSWIKAQFTYVFLTKSAYKYTQFSNKRKKLTSWKEISFFHTVNQKAFLTCRLLVFPNPQFASSRL